MANIVLTADSGADLPKEDARRLGVHVVPFHVSVGDLHFDDGERDAAEMLAMCSERDALPKTSACSPSDYGRAFAQVHEANPDAEILHLGCSAATTGSFDAATAAGEECGGVTCVDTMNVSGAYGLVVGKVSDFLRRNPDAPMADAVALARDLSRRARLGFVPRDLGFLRAGGRLTNAEFLAAQVLSVKPVIEMVDGRPVASRKLRGGMKRACLRFLDGFLTREPVASKQAVLLYSPGLDEGVRRLAEERARSLGMQDVQWARAGCVVSAHCGPGAFGCAMIAEA